MLPDLFGSISALHELSGDESTDKAQARFGVLIRVLAAFWFSTICHADTLVSALRLCAYRLSHRSGDPCIVRNGKVSEGAL